MFIPFPTTVVQTIQPSPHPPAHTISPLPSLPVRLPYEGISHEGIPDKGIPHEGIPHEGIPHEGTPQERIPDKGIPHEGIPHEGIPHAGTPQERIPVLSRERFFAQSSFNRHVPHRIHEDSFPWQIGYLEF